MRQCHWERHVAQSSQKKLPTKLKDPGSFMILCIVRTNEFPCCLCDLCASINLMPLSIFRKLGLGDVKVTNMTLQLVDHSIKRPYGVVEGRSSQSRQVYLSC